jgi:small-conductance mechanosensitive channel
MTPTTTLATESVATITSATVTEVVEKVAQAQFGVENFVPAEYMSHFSFLSNVSFFGNTLLEYIFAIAVALVAFAILPIVWIILKKYLVGVFGAVKPDIKELLKEQLNKFNSKIFLLAAIYIGACTLNLPENIFLVFKGILFALIGIQIAIILGPLLEPLIKSIPALNKPELKPITARIIAAAKTAMWAVVGLFSLSSLGVNTAPLLGGLGVLGLGGALAFQNMMPGFIKILSFHFSKSFSIGDKISAGTHQGVVEEIDISTTKIKKANGEVTEVKNEELMTAIVIPADGPHFISDTIKINLNIENDAATFSNIESIFKSCLQNIADTNFEKTVFTEFKGTGVACDLNYSVLIDKKIDNKHLILSKLITELKSKNIAFTGV